MEQKEKDQLKVEVKKVLSDVIDPELGIDLVNLGLIYGLEIDDDGCCTVTMTLTTMGCPIGDLLDRAIQHAVKGVDGITDCKILLTWEPAWTVDRMSKYAKIALGIHM